MVINPDILAELLGLSQQQLDVSGMRLSLDSIFKFGSGGMLKESVRELPIYEEIKCFEGNCHLAPGSYLIRYSEKVKVPDDSIAISFPRSSLIRMGATIFSAVWDPGYEGRGVGLLQVFNPHGIVIEKGAQVAQLVFIKMVKRASVKYSGVYQNEG